MQGISSVANFTDPALYSLQAAETGTVGEQLGLAMLDKSLDMAAGMGDSMAKMMERSVTPSVGGSIDTYA